VRCLALFFAVPALAAGAAPGPEAPEVPRAAHTATLLDSGEVLIAGGCTRDSCELDERGASTEIYDPRSRRFTKGPALLRPRVGHGAVRLGDGSVLVFGGWDLKGQTPSAERWRPGSQRFEPASPMRTARGGFTVTKLRDGRVLVVGGSGNGRALRSAELYEPVAGRFVATGSLRVARSAHTATLLPDGRVLVAGGGVEREGVFSSVEIWSPRTGRFAPAAPLLERRHKHAAVPVRGGVLVVGGSDERDFAGRRSSAELYLAGSRRWVRVGPLSAPRFKLGDAVVALPGGGALVAGGGPMADRYDPAGRRFRRGTGTGETLSFATATRLNDGAVLVVGGYDDRIALARGAWLLR
jgi:galactose oxidase-like protein